jgi:hypothetical protein
MNIYFVGPLSQGWGRMKKALFNPFDMGKWFAIGFTSFLAGLVDNPTGSSSSSWQNDRSFNSDEIFDLPDSVWGWLVFNSGWIILIIIGVLAILGMVIFLIWASSRGKFMFLDNVIHDRAQVKKPLHDFAKHGHSLFLWRLGFAAACFGVFVIFLILSFTLSSNIYFGNFSTTASVLA